ncbi:MAG: transcription antitermination factor NusB [Coriobacteriales bacterium]
MARRRADRATPARLLALELTREVRERDAYLRELVSAERTVTDLPAEEFDFAQVLAFGVVMCKGTLDEAIDRSLSSPRDVRPKVRDCLRISAYELLFLHKPAHAVVDQGVELVRSVTPRAAGLANAVLRKMAHDAREFPWGNGTTDDAAWARSYGMPPWLAKRLEAQYGREQASAIMKADLRPAPRYLRDNPFDPDNPFACDLSAQRVASFVPLEGPILEIGAGRGTKTMLLESRAVESLGHTVSIHAIELHEYRTQLHRERMGQMGIEDVLSLTGDARELDAIDGVLPHYDAVLLDAPCSGTGTMRRHPEIRWKLEPEDVGELAGLQRALLAEAARHVAPDGTLVYATCSILDEENQQVVDAFLATQPEGTWQLAEGSFASLPTLDGPDGHFAAVLQRV